MPGSGDDVSDKFLVALRVFFYQDNYVLDGRASGGCRFIISKLDSETVNLYLIINTPAKFYIAIGQVSGKIARLVKTIMRGSGKWAWDEFLRR
jgi:hypothetical protein